MKQSAVNMTVRVHPVIGFPIGHRRPGPGAGYAVNRAVVIPILSQASLDLGHDIATGGLASVVVIWIAVVSIAIVRVTTVAIAVAVVGITPPSAEADRDGWATAVIIRITAAIIVAASTVVTTSVGVIAAAIDVTRGHGAHPIGGHARRDDISRRHNSICVLVPVVFGLPRGREGERHNCS